MATSNSGSSTLHQYDRKIPAIMQRRPEVAKQETEVAFGVAAVDNPQKVTSAVSNEVEGQCPVCKTNMRIATDNGVHVYVCMTHRIVMPTRNEDA